MINKSSDSSGRALFTIEYNETINEVNKHTSCAKNTGVNVSVEQVSHEIYFPGSSYSIEVGDFHKSDTVQEEVMSATFFSFTAKDGLADESFVIGPSDIESSEINRKLHISPEVLLNKLSLIINS